MIPLFVLIEAMRTMPSQSIMKFLRCAQVLNELVSCGLPWRWPELPHLVGLIEASILFAPEFLIYIYSFAHRCQRCWIRLCIFRQRMRRLSLISRTASSGVATSDLPPKKRAKDNGAKLFGSDDSGVKGLKFSIASASARTVANSSKVSLLLAKTRFRWCLKLFSHASSKPLKCGERRYKMLRLLLKTVNTNTVEIGEDFNKTTIIANVDR